MNAAAGALLGASLLASLAACSPAGAVTAVDQKAGRCLAAYGWALDLATRGGDADLATAMVARGMFDTEMLKRSGGSPTAAQAEATAFILAHGGDFDRMSAVAAECMKAQEADPIFRANRTMLLERARVAQAAVH
jgi:hypothetical protein